MPVTVLRDPMALRVRVPLEESRTEHGLSDALDLLLATTKTFPKQVVDGADDPATFLVLTFHTRDRHGKRRWVSERRFFERCARHDALAAKVLAYVEHVNPLRWAKDPFFGAGFWTSTMAPAGSLAIVPLALRDARHLRALAEHLRGVDLDHETFHRALITEIVRRHGLGEQVLDLIAVRAVDGAGQHGPEDLRWLVAKTELGPMLASDEALDRFADRVDRVSRRTAKNYRALYVSNAGKALFTKERFPRWIAAFEAKGLTFDASEKQPEDTRVPFPPPPFEKEWEACASCDEID